MARTTPLLVQGVLAPGMDYDGTSDLTPFITAAYSTVNRVVVMAANKGFVLADSDLQLIETWLAAHYFKQSDKTYRSRSTAGASGSFDGTTNEGLDSTLYGQTAQRLDWTNCLRNLDKVQQAGMAWLGKPPSAQIPYDQRN